MSNDEILDELTRIRQEFEEILRKEGIIPFFDEPEAETETGLTSDEVQAWLKNELDFAKRIVTPLNPKHRGNRASEEALVRCRRMV